MKQCPDCKRWYSNEDTRCPACKIPLQSNEASSEAMPESDLAEYLELAKSDKT